MSAKPRWMVEAGLTPGSVGARYLGGALRTWRGRRSLTTVAPMVGVSPGTWGRWEMGRALPDGESWNRLMTVLRPKLADSIRRGVTKAEAEAQAMAVAREREAIADEEQDRIAAAADREAARFASALAGPSLTPTERDRAVSDYVEHLREPVKATVPPAGDPTYWMPGGKAPDRWDDGGAVRVTRLSGILEAVMASDLPDRSKAVLCSVVGALAADSEAAIGVTRAARD